MFLIVHISFQWNKYEWLRESSVNDSPVTDAYRQQLVHNSLMTSVHVYIHVCLSDSFVQNNFQEILIYALHLGFYSCVWMLSMEIDQLINICLSNLCKSWLLQSVLIGFCYICQGNVIFVLRQVRIVLTPCNLQPDISHLHNLLTHISSSNKWRMLNHFSGPCAFSFQL